MQTSNEIMSKKLISISPDHSILDAYHLMFDYKVRHLPVLDKNKKLVGLLSDRDVQRAMIVNKVSPYSQEITLNSEKKVEDFMSWPVFCVYGSCSIKSVVDEIIHRKVSALVVTNEEGDVTGIITTEDLLKLLYDRMTREEEVLKKPLSFLNCPISLVLESHIGQ